MDQSVAIQETLEREENCIIVSFVRVLVHEFNWEDWAFSFKLKSHARGRKGAFQNKSLPHVRQR